MKKSYISQSPIDFKHEYLYDVPHICLRLYITNKQYNNKWNVDSACWFVISDNDNIILNLDVDFNKVEFFTI